MYPEEIDLLFWIVLGEECILYMSPKTKKKNICDYMLEKNTEIDIFMSIPVLKKKIYIYHIQNIYIKYKTDIMKKLLHDSSLSKKSNNRHVWTQIEIIFV